MLFSVIIPVYNSKNFIRKSVDSVLSQTFRNFELVIIDDGSTDGTEEMIDDYSRIDPRVIVYRFENSGVSMSRRRGVSLARGKYLLFVDSDDTINPRLLQEIYHTILKFEEPDIIRYQANLLMDSPHKNHDRYNFTDLFDNPLSGMATLKLWSSPGKKYAVYWLYAFKRSVFSNILFSPDLRCYEDVALIPLLIATSNKIVTINYTGYNYTCNNALSLTNFKSEAAEKSRAIDFFKAYNYAIENFLKIDNVSTADIAFFIDDYNRRLKGKFDSLSEALKSDLRNLFNM